MVISSRASQTLPVRSELTVPVHVFSYAVDNLHNTAGDVALSLNNGASYTIIRDAGIRSGTCVSGISVTDIPDFSHRRAAPEVTGQKDTRGGFASEPHSQGHRHYTGWLNGRVSDRKSTRLNSSHSGESRMPSSA